MLKALKSKKFLLVAIVFHAVVDFFASVMTYSLQLPVWSVEGVIAAITMGIFIYAYYMMKKKASEGDWNCLGFSFSHPTVGWYYHICAALFITKATLSLVIQPAMPRKKRLIAIYATLFLGGNFDQS